MQLDKTLQKYGLTVKESRLYLALLELGRSTILQLAKKTKSKRAGLYYTVQGLVKTGLVREVKIAAKRYWEAIDPELLVAQENERHQLLLEALPEMRAINNLSPNKPRVTHYSGFDGAAKATDELYRYILTLPESKREILQYTNFASAPRVRTESRSQAASRRIELGIPIRNIAPAVGQNLELAKLWNSAPERLSETRLAKDLSIPYIALLIAGNRLVFSFLDPNKDPGVLVVEDADQAEIQRYLFNQLWRSLPNPIHT
ncbi:MAG: helix-turn-helix domain-containing protein [bacterium]